MEIMNDVRNKAHQEYIPVATALHLIVKAFPSDYHSEIATYLRHIKIIENLQLWYITKDWHFLPISSSDNTLQKAFENLAVLSPCHFDLINERRVRANTDRMLNRFHWKRKDFFEYKPIKKMRLNPDYTYIGLYFFDTDNEPPNTVRTLNDLNVKPVGIQAENEQLKARIAELESQPQSTQATLDEMNSNEALAYMAVLLAKSSGAYKYGEKPNAKKIGDAVATMAQYLNPNEEQKFKALNKKISKALKTFSTD